MVATQTFLNTMAAALAQETYVVPAYLAFGTSSISPSLTDTAIDGEVGDRSSLSNPSREDNEVTYTALRLAGDVVGSSGDNIKSLGLLTAATDGDLLTLRSLPGILQTTSFDIDVTVKVRFE